MCVVLSVNDRTGSLDEVPFMVPLGSLDEPLGEQTLVTAPEINMPDYHQILKETQVLHAQIVP